MVGGLLNRIGITESARVKKIREHVASHIPPLEEILNGQKLPILAVVHPHFPLLESDDEDTSEMEGELTQRIAIYESEGRRSDKREAEHMLQYLREPEKLNRYLERLDFVLAHIDRSRVITVLAELSKHYWHGSDKLVENGFFDYVVVTDGRGVVISSEIDFFFKLTENTHKAYVTGAYGFQCPANFAVTLNRQDVSITPVKDLLFDKYNRPEEYLVSVWEKEKDLHRASRRAIESRSLPLLN